MTRSSLKWEMNIPVAGYSVAKELKRLQTELGDDPENKGDKPNRR